MTFSVVCTFIFAAMSPKQDSALNSVAGTPFEATTSMPGLEFHLRTALTALPKQILPMAMLELILPSASLVTNCQRLSPIPLVLVGVSPMVNPTVFLLAGWKMRTSVHGTSQTALDCQAEPSTTWLLEERTTWSSPTGT